MADSSSKTLVVIRHGTSVHNEYLQTLREQLGESAGTAAWDHWLRTENHQEAGFAYPPQDTALVATGVTEAKQLGERLRSGEVFTDSAGVPHGSLCDLDLILVSPLLRTLETCTHVFGTEPLVNRSTKQRIPIVALDSVVEAPQGGHICNRRNASREERQEAFPHVDFSLVADLDTQWSAVHAQTSGTGESAAMLQDRVQVALNIIRQRPEANIAIVSHSCFLSALLYGPDRDSVGGGLKHCSPYVVKI